MAVYENENLPKKSTTRLQKNLSTKMTYSELENLNLTTKLHKDIIRDHLT